MELTDLTISEAAAMIEHRRISPTELIRAHLYRIETLDLHLHTFITLTPEIATKHARTAETEIMHGAYRSHLHGIPIALKDLYETAGIRTTAGSKFLKEYVPAADSHAVQQLDNAGAISLGKLNMHEWALGVTTINEHYGACRNPWDAKCIPGGSSGGSGAALAAGFCMGALGSDTRGSIRIPAALCGVVGLKPTYGRVSVRGVIPLSWHLDHAGPMARTVRDVALLLDAIAGYDPDDPFSVDTPAGNYLADLDHGVKGWTIGVLDGHFADADPEILTAFEHAVRVFTELGAEIRHIDLDWAVDAYRKSEVILGGDAATYHRERLQERPEDFGKEMIARMERYSGFTAADYADARYAAVKMREQIKAVFKNCGVLLSPTAPMAAVRRDDPEQLGRARATLTRFTAPFNMVGVPALSVPCGFTADGLPIGLQIIGGHWEEAAVLRAGHAYQQATEWHRRKPEL